jgi:hypothetical protein
MMALDILAGDIGEKRLVSIGLSLEDKAPLGSEIAMTVSPTPEVETELKGHIEAREAAGAELYAREVMNGIARALDDLLNFSQAKLPGVYFLKGATGKKVAVNNAENDSLKDRPVGPLKRAVNENGFVKPGAIPGHATQSTLAAQAPGCP